MLNQRLESCITELDVDEDMKHFIKEILIYEWETIDEKNYRYGRMYDNLIDKYLRKE